MKKLGHLYSAKQHTFLPIILPVRAAVWTLFGDWGRPGRGGLSDVVSRLGSAERVPSSALGHSLGRSRWPIYTPPINIAETRHKHRRCWDRMLIRDGFIRRRGTQAGDIVTKCRGCRPSSAQQAELFRLQRDDAENRIYRFMSIKGRNS